MTETTVDHVDANRIDDAAPPPGTAIVRPLRHVQAVRERYLQRFTDPAQAATSRSARAWAWALGETNMAPVTDRETAVPPSRPEIEAQIAVADERRLHGEQENRADAAATILRWLIGEDDHVPVRGENVGELVGGLGEVVRSREQLADVLALAAASQRQVAAKADGSSNPGDRQLAQRDSAYLNGVIATLTWTLGERAEAPITGANCDGLTTQKLKSERVRAEDMVEQSRFCQITDLHGSPWYGEGVKTSITWLLGERTVPPID